MELKPEEVARKGIDALLEKAGWVIQDYRAFHPGAGLGLAVREVPTSSGPADYLPKPWASSTKTSLWITATTRP